MRRSVQRKHKNKRKLKKRCFYSKDENLRVKTPNGKEKSEALSENLDERKGDMNRKLETSSDSESSKHDSTERTLQEPYVNKSTLECFGKMKHREFISQSQSTSCSSLDGDNSTSNDGGDRKWEAVNARDEKTIRWENCCNNPIKEVQRIEKYKADRRQRYYDQEKSEQTSNRYYARI